MTVLDGVRSVAASFIASTISFTTLTTHRQIDFCFMFISFYSVLLDTEYLVTVFLPVNKQGGRSDIM
jgi:hypothetical protein